MPYPTNELTYEQASGTREDPTLVASVAFVAWPELHEAAYHGPAGELALAIAPHTEADPVAILAQTLVAFGSAVGRGPFFRVEADDHFPNLFLAQVGKTSRGRKGTSWGHVKRAMHEVDHEWTDNNIKPGLSSGEGLIWAVRDPIEKQDPIREKGRVVEYEWVIDDPGVDDKRLTVFQGELGSTLRVLCRNGNTLSPLMREAWDTGNLRTLTKNSPAHATGAHISIIGHITEDELLRYLDDTEVASGWANRFIFVCVRRCNILPHGGRPNDEILRPIIQRMKDARQQAENTTEVTLSQEARHMWEVAYPTLSADIPGLLGAVTARAEAQTIRLAMIYALLDGNSVIRGEHLRAAIAFWEYAHQSAQQIFGDALGVRTADAILHGLLDSPEGLTRTQIRNLLGRHSRKESIEDALALLERTGRAKRESEDTGGRPTERWVATYATKATKGGPMSLMSLLSQHGLATDRRVEVERRADSGASPANSANRRLRM